jgi:hypothetical protein
MAFRVQGLVGFTLNLRIRMQEILGFRSLHTPSTIPCGIVDGVCRERKRMAEEAKPQIPNPEP